MPKNKHMVNVLAIADLIPMAKTEVHKQILRNEWFKEMRKSLRASRGGFANG